ncbi:dipeptidyl-peptidase IV [Clostridium sp.]|uniref:dipeptidyl-peptidase IV n=1 Tax=Clostridium sp. TaxID=1506 RepID=UPI00284A0D19|nr:dipeptidyl-peptidase IV [Clostridium sp.]MDR3594702.1 dipeptidyl-peptidase IV [Clostridium sp.]
MKKLIVWTTLALMLEISLLYGLNNFVFTNSSEFNSKKIEIKKDFANGINVTIPSNTENINLSYEGKYLTYFKEKNLYIQDTKTGKVSEINTENNEVIMCYRWLDSRDLIAIVEKVKKDGKEKVQLITYNPENSSKTLVKEICKYEKNMVVNNMTTSVLTNVFYIDINKGGSRNVVYRIDRNEDLTNIDIKANSLGNMQVIPHEDRLIYEDNINDKFFITSPNKQLMFNSNNKLTLLGIDKNDVIYMGEINGDKISSIVYGKVDEDTSTWNTVTIDSSVGKNDLYFSDESEMLINDNLKGKVINLTTGKEIEYEGKLIQIKEGFIAIIDSSGKLVYKNFKK